MFLWQAPCVGFDPRRTPCVAVRDMSRSVTYLVLELSPDDATDLVRVRRAIAVARTDAVASCPTIVQLLDYEDVILRPALECHP